jgi:DDE superfamily endonuclease
MEDVLEVYQRPYDPTRPQVCIDETSKQLLEHTRVPIPASPATPARVGDDGVPIPASPATSARVDDEYKRCGTANIFAAVEPITGTCLVQATEHRTAIDMAKFLRRLSDEVYVTATAIVLVMDNLNIHALSCLYEAFPPAEARRLTQRFEVHHTPKHGSWLDVAETFLSVLARQCLDQRIPTIARLQEILAAWHASRKGGKVTWRFTTANARVKLHRLYPSIP